MEGDRGVVGLSVSRIMVVVIAVVLDVVGIGRNRRGGSYVRSG